MRSQAFESAAFVSSEHRFDQLNENAVMEHDRHPKVPERVKGSLEWTLGESAGSPEPI